MTQKLFKVMDGHQVAYDGDCFQGILDVKPGISFTDAFEAFVRRFAQVNGLPLDNPCQPYVKASEGSKMTAAEITTAVPLSSQERKSSCYSEVAQTSFNYEVLGQPSGTTFFWDLHPVLNGIPAGWEVASVSVIVFGSISSSTGQTTLGQSEMITSGISVPPNRYPINAVIKINLNTSCGTMLLSANVFIDRPNVKGVEMFTITESVAGQNSDLSQEAFNRMLNTVTKDLSLKIDQQSKVSIGSLPNTTYPTENTNRIIHIQAGYIDQLFGKIKAMESVNVTAGFEDAQKKLSDTIKTLESQLAALKSSQELMDARLRTNEALINALDGNA